MPSFLQNLLYLAPVALLPMVQAGFNANANNNIAVYWGQNSYGQQASQSRLSTYCSNSDIDIIPLAFLNVIVNPTTVNFANAGDNCTVFSGTTLLSCPQIEEDIKTCQSTYGKTILLSMGGATYTEGGFTSSDIAVSTANKIWAMFGPVQSGSTVNRPFGSAVVDGFDFDFESSTQNMAPFAQQLRSLMDADTSKKYYLSAAPQCVYPDVADNDMLDGAVSFDFILIQFYNNYCGIQNFVSGSSTQSAFNFATWDNWAKTVSKNKSVKVFLGVPGGSTGGGGYQPASSLAGVITYCKTFSSFGGVMIWDMSQLVENPGFFDTVNSELGGNTAVTTTTPPATTTTPATTLTTVTKTTSTTAPSTTTPSTTLVPQWGQCGGNGYTGPTQCQSPYTCVATSEWWAQCE